MKFTKSPDTDAVFRSQKFDTHIQCINASNAIAKHARSLEEQRNEAFRTLALARDYVSDQSLTSDGIIDRKTIVRMIDQLLPISITDAPLAARTGKATA